MSADDAFITYRYALNSLQGNGLVFNPHERVLATTAPFHALVLIPLAAVFVDHLPLIANLLSAAMLFMTAWFAYCFLAFLGYRAAGLLAALLITLNIWTYAFFPLESVLLIGLEIATLYLYVTRQLRWAAGLAALAIMTRYDAAILVGLLGMHAAYWAWRSHKWNELIVPLGIFVGILIAWVGFATFYYGSPLPNTFNAKSAIAGNWGVFVGSAWSKVLQLSLASPWASAIALMLALLSLPLMWTDPARDELFLLPLWAGLYIAAYTLLRIIFPHSWYYYPLVVLLFLLSSYAAERLYRMVKARLSPLLTRIWRLSAWLAVAGLLVMQLTAVWEYSIAHHTSPWTTAREKTYVAVANWLKENTAADAKVALLEIGIVGYYSERNIVDLLGLATPAATANAREDWSKNINLLKPDYVVMQNRKDGSVESWSWDTPDTDVLIVQGQVYNDYPLVHTMNSDQYAIRIYARR